MTNSSRRCRTDSIAPTVATAPRTIATATTTTIGSRRVVIAVATVATVRCFRTAIIHLIKSHPTASPSRNKSTRIHHAD